MERGEKKPFSVVERWKTLTNLVQSHPEKTLNRQPARLIAVSKGQTVEAIETLLKAGQRDFGENRLQEAAHKWTVLKKVWPDVRLHLIGGLQTNKVKQALELFDVIHTVDRENLVQALEEANPPAGIQFFLQVNTGDEPQKGGVSAGALTKLLESCRSHRLPVTGLMCIPPANEAPGPHFAFLQCRARELGLTCLSMGMSGDYETALRLGATHVRIGTALFGERDAG